MNGLNTFALKWIAIISMLIDHTGAVLFPQYEWMRIVGRLAFPIFAFLLVEGFVHTSDVKKYMIRLGAFALVSEIPFDLAFFGTLLEFTHQNVFFTLFMGILMLYLMLQTPSRGKQIITMIAALLISDYLCMDYGSWGLLMILAYYEMRDKKILKLVAVAVVNIFFMGYTQIYAAFAMIPIAFHNGKLGPKMKMFFYAFYPAHLVILYLISLII